jgi:hypothetical protein
MAQVTQIIYRIETVGGPDDVRIYAVTHEAYAEFRQILAYQTVDAEDWPMPLLILEFLLTNLDRPTVHRLCHEIKDIVGDRTVRLIELPVLQDRVF